MLADTVSIPLRKEPEDELLSVAKALVDFLQTATIEDFMSIKDRPIVLAAQVAITRFEICRGMV